MNSKILILSLAVVAVGLFALPSTMSLFNGQHTWYNVDDIKCQKCHSDIYTELTTQSAYHGKFESSYGNACSRCHFSVTNVSRVATGANLTAQQWQAYPRGANNTSAPSGAVNISAHAAITVECLACHGTSNVTNGSNSPLKLMSDTEAHKTFYYAAVSNKSVGDVNYQSLKDAGIITAAPQWYDTSRPNQTVVQLKGSNAACIGCHTHAVVNITWTRSIGYEMQIDSTNNGWNVNFTGVSATKNTTTTSSE